MKMENLTDDLLVEILIRLPCKTAMTCKSISKRFLALICHRDFIERFIHRYHTLFRHFNDEDRENQWCLNFVSRHKLLILFLPNNNNNNNIYLHNLDIHLSLSFLGPKFDPKHENAIEPAFLTTNIVASSNGLLLCSSRKSPSKKTYYACNPLTMDWVQFPSPARTCGFHHVFVEGFICEPYYHYHYHVQQDKVTLNNTHRFRVVLIDYFFGSRSKFEVVVFSSETRQWTTKLVSCPKGFTLSTLLLPAVANGGKLYFMGRTSLLMYDPFNDDDGQCDTLDYPTNLHIPFTGHVGVSCGNIRICDISPTTPNVPVTVTVWELYDHYDSAGWRLLHKTCFPLLDIENCVRPELGATNRSNPQVGVQAFHPHHGDVVFFQYAHRIFCANLKIDLFNTVAYGVLWLQIIPLDLPWWPTPVPSIQ